MIIKTETGSEYNFFFKEGNIHLLYNNLEFIVKKIELENDRIYVEGYILEGEDKIPCRHLSRLGSTTIVECS